MIINNKLTSDKQCIANGFSIHYSSIGSNLANDIKSRTDPMHYVSYPSHNDFSTPTITPEEEHELLHDCQFGFRRGHSTRHAVC